MRDRELKLGQWDWTDLKAISVVEVREIGSHQMWGTVGVRSSEKWLQLQLIMIRKDNSQIESQERRQILFMHSLILRVCGSHMWRCLARISEVSSANSGQKRKCSLTYVSTMTECLLGARWQARGWTGKG